MNQNSSPIHPSSFRLHPSPECSSANNPHPPASTAATASRTPTPSGTTSPPAPAPPYTDNKAQPAATRRTTDPQNPEPSPPGVPTRRDESSPIAAQTAR